jgi:hypothetical protein
LTSESRRDAEGQICLIVICVGRNWIPFTQQRFRRLQLASNRRRCIRTHRDTHRHIPTLRQPSVHQNINDDLRSLGHVANLLAVHVTHPTADLSDFRLIVYVKASRVRAQMIEPLYSVLRAHKFSAIDPDHRVVEGSMFFCLIMAYMSPRHVEFKRS